MPPVLNIWVGTNHSAGGQHRFVWIKTEKVYFLISGYLPCGNLLLILFVVMNSLLRETEGNVINFSSDISLPFSPSPATICIIRSSCSSVRSKPGSCFIICSYALKKYKTGRAARMSSSQDLVIKYSQSRGGNNKYRDE